MNIEEVYEKYKHMDKALSDKEWLIINVYGYVLYDLWQAIKFAQEKKIES